MRRKSVDKISRKISRSGAALIWLLVGLLSFCLSAYADELTKPVDPPKHVQTKIKNEILDQLFKQLHDASDSKTAQGIAQKIQNFYLRSGSDTTVLLSQRSIELVTPPSKDISDSLKILEAIIQTEPTYIEAYNGRGAIYGATGHLDLAAKDFYHVLSIEPRHFNTLIRLGMLYEFAKKPEEALFIYKKVLDIYPLNVSVRDKISQLEEQLHKESI